MIYIAQVAFVTEIENPKTGAVVQKRNKKDFIVEDAVAIVDAETQIHNYLKGDGRDYEIVQITQKDKIEAIIKKI